jgi:hypothetical protein|tara:strand:- start:2411 stop:2716 length:306 start_codon:yes stop_codon:yes gene_type:complete
MYNNTMPRRRNTLNNEEPEQIHFEQINLNPTPKFDLKNFICADYLKNNYYDMAKQLNRKIECPVCLEEICCQKCMSILPCGHVYHLCCLMKCDMCPLCRGS